MARDIILYNSVHNLQSAMLLSKHRISRRTLSNIRENANKLSDDKK